MSKLRERVEGGAMVWGFPLQTRGRRLGRLVNARINSGQVCGGGGVVKCASAVPGRSYCEMAAMNAVSQRSIESGVCGGVYLHMYMQRMWCGGSAGVCVVKRKCPSECERACWIELDTHDETRLIEFETPQGSRKRNRQSGTWCRDNGGRGVSDEDAENRHRMQRTAKRNNSDNLRWVLKDILHEAFS